MSGIFAVLTKWDFSYDCYKLILLISVIHGGVDRNLFWKLFSVLDYKCWLCSVLSDSLSKPLRHSLSEDDVQIPAEPPGKCSMRLQVSMPSNWIEFFSFAIHQNL